MTLLRKGALRATCGSGLTEAEPALPAKAKTILGLLTQKDWSACVDDDHHKKLQYYAHCTKRSEAVAALVRESKAELQHLCQVFACTMQQRGGTQGREPQS